MASISGLSATAPIYAQQINNFTGELFKVGGQRTPLLSAVGGLNGGKVLNSTFWQVQVEDNATVSSEPTKAQEGNAPTEYLGRDRAAYTYVTQIFHKGVQMTYTALASTQNQNPFDLSANAANFSNGTGGNTAGDKLALFGGSPVADEFAFQMEKAMEKVAREVEWFAFNGSFSDGANTSPGSGTREMYGLDVWITINKNANNAAAVNPLGGNCYYNDVDGDGTGASQVISFKTISGALKRMYDNHAPMSQPVLCVSPKQLLDLNNELVKGTVDIAGTIIPRDRNVAGVDIDTIITPFGSIGLMVIDPDIMPAGSAFILDLAYIQTVFTNIPGYGTMFVRDIDQDANARIGKAIYMEMGFEFGPPSYHCKIQSVA
jgi:hypothetical protein|tara:strand:+ start:5115 stop:6239 length:1125 start_codon:yes stop_codon:yes gene_type:complete